MILQVSYHGRVMPQASDFLGEPMGLQQPKSERFSAFAEPDGARDWFPCNDHPLDKAAFRLEATIPEGLAAVSNGTLLATRKAGGQSTYVWYEDAPMATYLLTLAVGHYRRVDQAPVGGVQIRHYVFEDDPQAAGALSPTEDALQFLSEQIAPYPFKELGFVEVIAPGLAMETQTMIMIDQGFLQSQSAWRSASPPLAASPPRS